MTTRTRASVPPALQTAAAVGWRVLVVAAALILAALILARLTLVFIPFVIALLLATFLVPPARWLRERGIPDTLAAIVVVVVALGLLGVVVWLIAPQVADEFSDVGVNLREAVDRAERRLVDLGVGEERLERYVDQAEAEIRARSGTILGGVLAGAALVIEVLIGAVLALFLLFFFVKDGERIWRWFVGLFPASRRADVRQIGELSWLTLGGYLRGTSIVALFDALFIGLALLVVGVPLVLPLAVLTFFGGFFPIVGAFIAGSVAVLVALVTEGLVAALIILGAIILVQQLEGNLLQPFIVGRAVQLHPVAVLLAVTAGGVIWGLIGAFIAVPLAAVVNKAASYLRSRPA